MLFPCNVTSNKQSYRFKWVGWGKGGERAGNSKRGVNINDRTYKKGIQGFADIFIIDGDT